MHAVEQFMTTPGGFDRVHHLLGRRVDVQWVAPGSCRTLVLDDGQRDRLPAGQLVDWRSLRCRRTYSAAVPASPSNAPSASPSSCVGRSSRMPASVVSTGLPFPSFNRRETDGRVGECVGEQVERRLLVGRGDSHGPVVDGRFVDSVSSSLARPPFVPMPMPVGGGFLEQSGEFGHDALHVVEG